MKFKSILLALGGLTISMSGMAQSGSCGTPSPYEIDPNWGENEVYSGQEESSKMATKTIPVVFHILHDNGIGNISKEQCQSVLDVLNEDFQRLNSDTSATRQTAMAPFKQYAGAMDIEFRMARIDPQGNCTDGIERKNVGNTNRTYNVPKNYPTNEPHKHASTGGLDAWPRSNYFNIWIVNSIDNGGSAGIILGYAQFPGWNDFTNTYGITMRQDYAGRIGTAAGQDGRTITHEVGHCFNLAHIFEGGCGSTCSGGGDKVCDTPPQQDADYTCSQTLNTCSAIPSGDPYGFDTYDQVENYMSYNSCQNMFSIGQVAKMNQAFNTYGYLNTLASANNANNTGINQPDALCKAEFETMKTTICAGETVQFNDVSYNFVNGWNWTFNGGSPASSTAQNPSVTYNTPGLYEVSLTATDGSSSDTETKTAFIKVLPASESLPFLETFESYTTLTGIEEWEVKDEGNNAKFEITNTAGHTGSQSAKLANFGQSAGNVDELISSPVDLSGITSTVTMSFRYAYRLRATSNDEWLKVYVSADCGDSWVQRKTLHGTMLTNLVETTSWTPASQTDWTTVHMTNVTSTYWVDNFRYKFRFESDAGNNFYLDNINIYASAPSDNLVVGLDETDLVQDLNLYPNPADNELNVQFSVGAAQSMVFTITDISGKEIQSSVINANAGSNLVMMNTNGLASGMYFLNLRSGVTQQTLQFVIK